MELDVSLTTLTEFRRNRSLPAVDGPGRAPTLATMLHQKYTLRIIHVKHAMPTRNKKIMDTTVPKIELVLTQQRLAYDCIDPYN